MLNSFLCMFLFRSDLARRAMEDKNLPSGLYSDLLEGRTCFVCLKVSKQLAQLNARSEKLRISLSFAHLTVKNL